jgi:hypothetical protein
MIDQRWWGFKAREALRKIDGAGLGGELAHDREYRGADVGELAGNCLHHLEESMRYAALLR